VPAKAEPGVERPVRIVTITSRRLRVPRHSRETSLLPRSGPHGLGIAILTAMLALAACERAAPGAMDRSAGNDLNMPSVASLRPDDKSAKIELPPTPARLRGLSGNELEAALGEPTLLRQDGGAQLWQYSGSGCVLHVFLYDDHGTYRVVYSRVRVDDPEIANPPTCVEWKGKAQAATAGRPAQPAPTGEPHS
jgi:hypothetical protein